jgi:hypothetical protein
MIINKNNHREKLRPGRWTMMTPPDDDAYSSHERHHCLAMTPG